MSVGRSWSSPPEVSAVGPSDAMEITFSDDGRDFVRRDWTGIADSDPSATFFHTPRYLKLYWEEFGDAVDLLLVFAVRGEETSGAVAFERSGGTLRFLGGTEVTDYMGPVARAGAHGAVATGLLAALAARDDWEEAELLGLP